MLTQTKPAAAGRAHDEVVRLVEARPLRTARGSWRDRETLICQVDPEEMARAAGARPVTVPCCRTGSLPAKREPGKCQGASVLNRRFAEHGAVDPHLIEIVNDDMPFMVGHGVTMEVTATVPRCHLNHPSDGGRE